MLTQNFQTPTALGISDVEFEALVKVLGMLERGEIPEQQFHMDRVQHTCGTPSCICGWANHISNGAAFPLTGIFQDAPNWDSFSENLLTLFSYGPRNPGWVDSASTAQAAIALHNYLTHGEPRWEEAECL